MGGTDEKKGKLQKTRDEVARRGERIAEVERAHRRLEHLYEISKLLTRYRSVEQTVPEVMALLAQALPLRSAIFILETADTPRTIAWQAQGETAQRLRAARTHAQNAYRYLVRSAVELEHQEARSLELPPQPATEQPEAEKRFVILPLVVDHGSIFGALQIETAGPLVEHDVGLINVVINQLAIAVDRQAIINASQAAAELGETEQRLLADVSSAVSGSLEYRNTLTAVARFVVSRMADLCIVDEVREDGTVGRLAVLFADEGKQRELAERLMRFAPQAGWQTLSAKAVASRKSLLVSRVTDPLAEGIAHDEDHADALRAAGIISVMAVPLVARGKVLGVLKFMMAESGRHYSAHDLSLAEEIARRCAVAIDNAQLHEQAHRATRSREDLLAVVSHDLKNPLGSILMGIAMLMKLPEDELSTKSRKHLERVERSALRMNRLIEDLLDTASIEAGRLSVEQRRLEAVPLVSEAVDALQPLAGSKSLHLKSDLPPELPALHADGARLQQVLANLLGNAIKFTPAGGAITVRAQPSGDAVKFSVTDTGPGIPSQDLPHLFDRFWQAKRTAGLGTGLGLFIVKGIVEAHRGRVWVESRLGEGSTFFFTVPVAPPGADQPPIEVPAP